MLRYVALQWDSSSSQQTDAAQVVASRLRSMNSEWESVLEGDGVRVFCVDAHARGSRCRRMAQVDGVVLGTLFKRSDPTSADSALCGEEIDAQESKKIFHSSGRRLISDYWGSYVAIISDPHEHRTLVLCGPLGTLPCLLTEYRGVRVFFSHVRDCAALRLLRLSVSWQFIARHLSRSVLPHQTGLAEITTLLGGECCEVHQGKLSRKMYWDALSQAHHHRMEDNEQATLALYSTTKACLHAWASCFDGILLRLSGGLDSSIVLGCLRDAPSAPTVTCLNRYSPAGGDSDERSFARLAAQHAGCRLIELARDSSFAVEPLLEAWPTERPILYLVALGQGSAEFELARSLQHEAIFTGNGGDEIFLNGNAQLSVSDFIHDRGFKPELLEVALGAARLEKRSVFHVLATSLMQGWGRPRYDGMGAVRAISPLVNWPVVESFLGAGASHTPWYAKERYVPLGKQSQILRLNAESRGRCSPAFDRPGDPIDLSPLLSQPLVELCLRIPTYHLIRGGWDRALARRVFAADVPHEILARRWKGGQESYTAEIFSRNLGFMREMLLNGHLVRAGFLNRSKLEAVLSERPSNVMRGLNRISKHLALEIWLRVWERHGALVSETSDGTALMPELVEA